MQLFSDSFAALLGAIVYKQQLLASGGAERIHLALGKADAHYGAALQQLVSADFLKRIWAHDATLWSNDPDAIAIIKKALGWLDIQQHMLDDVAALKAFANETKESFDSAVVCGMGGSSLAPDIIADTFGPIAGYPHLYVLDSTSPQQIKELEEKIDVPTTLFIISSKSGTTTEPNAFYAYFHEKVSKQVERRRPPETSSPSPTPERRSIKRRKDEAFRADFENDPNIGGRYSALSFVGIAPSAIAGYDINLLLDRALGAMHANDRTVDPRNAPGVRFGAAIGGLAVNGRDKLTIVTHRRGQGFRRVGRTAYRRVDRQARQRASFRSKASRSARPAITPTIASSCTSAPTCPIPNPASTRSSRALEAAGHPVIRLR